MSKQLYRTFPKKSNEPPSKKRKSEMNKKVKSKEKHEELTITNLPDDVLDLIHAFNDPFSKIATEWQRNFRISLYKQPKQKRMIVLNREDGLPKKPGFYFFKCGTCYCGEPSQYFLEEWIWRSPGDLNPYWPLRARLRILIDDLCQCPLCPYGRRHIDCDCA